jgi:hypothetical protein
MTREKLPAKVLDRLETGLMADSGSTAVQIGEHTGHSYHTALNVRVRPVNATLDGGADRA